jgi:hypothetical protein
MQAVLPYLLMVVGTALAGVFVMQSLRRRQPAEKITPHEKLDRARQVTGTSTDLRQMMIELEELTRRLGEELDSKSGRLQKLLHDAERAIAELEKHRKASPRVIPSKRFEEEAGPQDPLMSKVYQMADGGVPSIEIAKQLHEQIGKVELILALRQQR